MTAEYPTDQYRFILRRQLRPLYRTDRRRRLGVVMINPSSATEEFVSDAKSNDNTIRSLLRIAEYNAFEAITVTNLSPYRATDPADLVDSLEAGIDIFAREQNDAAISVMLSECLRVICAWGANVNRHLDLEARASEVRTRLEGHPGGPYCMHTTKEGYPRHPMYLPRATLIYPWRRT